MRFSSRSGIRVPAFLIFLLVCWWAFSFTFLKTEFTNDDFDHLSRARQVLFGELPDRDFYDDGRPLTIAVSVVAQLIRPNLLSELTYRAGFIAAGVGFVYLLSFGLSRSILLSMLAALVTVAMRPRLYNYPKIFLLPFGLWLLWRYIDQPTRGRLAALTAATVMAFLFRYDFGLYLALISVCTMIGIHGRSALKPLVFYAAWGTVVCLPYFGWLASQGRLLSIGAKGATEMAAKAPLIVSVPFQMDLSHGLVYVRPPQWHVNIRWTADVDGETRRALERRYGLDPIDVKSDRQTFVYVFNEPTSERIRQLMSDSRIEDTSGIDRSTGDRLIPSRWDRWQAAVPLLRLDAARIFRRPDDAQGWLFGLFIVSVPIACLVLILFPDARITHGRAKILSLALMCLVLQHFLMFDKVETHLPNVAGVTMALWTWPVRRMLDGLRALRKPWNWFVGSVGLVALLSLMLITWLSVATFAGASLRSVLRAGAAGPAAFVQVIRDNDQPPLGVWTNDRSVGTKAIIRYVARCLSPNDRPLLLAFAPDIFYVSERLFAGGLNSYHPNGFNPSGAEILRWLRRQSVPLVIADRFPPEWADLEQYVFTRYREVAVTAFGEDSEYHILVDSQRRPTGFDPQWGLPCFSERNTEGALR